MEWLFTIIFSLVLFYLVEFLLPVFFSRCFNSHICHLQVDTSFCWNDVKIKKQTREKRHERKSKTTTALAKAYTTAYVPIYIYEYSSFFSSSFYIFILFTPSTTQRKIQMYFLYKNDNCFVTMLLIHIC